MGKSEQIERFFKAWLKGDVVKMYLSCQKTWIHNHTKNELKGMLPRRIKGYSIQRTIEHPDLHIVDLEMTIRLGGEDIKVKPRFVREKAPYTPREDGELGINPVSLIKYLPK